MFTGACPEVAGTAVPSDMCIAGLFDHGARRSDACIVTGSPVGPSVAARRKVHCWRLLGHRLAVFIGRREQLRLDEHHAATEAVEKASAVRRAIRAADDCLLVVEAAADGCTGKP